jgi:hypothetical protein
LGSARDDSDDRGLARTICEACVNGLNIDGASISVLTVTDARETLSATNRTAQLLEDLQFTLNDGPCVEAALTGDPVLVPDVQDPTDTARWPAFAAAVMEQNRGPGPVRSAPAVGCGQPGRSGSTPARSGWAERR